MPTLLALDAGGTTTRAVALTDAGVVLGRGRSGPGSPTAAAIDVAVASIAAAADEALGGSVAPGRRVRVALAVVAMAGEKSPEFRARLTARLGALGVERVTLQHDLLAVFCSGTASADGYALVAGTGTVAARVVDGGLAAVAGGRGWLLGDAGGGFWVGRRVVRAVMADLDGLAAPTALTPPVLHALGVPTDAGRANTIAHMVSTVYGRRPVALAELAPLAFAAAPDDVVARGIVVAASRALAELLGAVRVPDPAGPVVVGGSVLVHGILGAPADLARDLEPLPGDGPVVAVPDGELGAAVLALREYGVPVDEKSFTAVREQVR